MDVRSPQQNQKLILESVNNHLAISGQDATWTNQSFVMLSKEEGYTFWEILSKSNVTSLNMSGSYNSITYYSGGISGVVTTTSHRWSNNYFWLYESEAWKSFGRGLSTTSITSLDFYGNEFYKLNEEQWLGFGKGLFISKITSLNLSTNHLGRMEEDKQWLGLGAGLSLTNIASLNLSHNDLYELNEIKWFNIRKGLSDTPLKILDVSWNDLYKLNESGWKAFCQCISQLPITSLKMRDNGLDKLDGKKWDIFWNALAASQITFLDLGGNDISKHKQWLNYCKGIAKTLITNLILESKDSSFVKFIPVLLNITDDDENIIIGENWSALHFACVRNDFVNIQKRLKDGAALGHVLNYCLMRCETIKKHRSI